MKKLLIALVLSALTLVGGHFFNRRWDRAILFFLVFVLCGVLSSVAAMFGMLGSAEIKGPHEAEAFLSSHQIVFAVAVSTLWLVSLVVVFWDAKYPRAASQHSWTPGGVVGAVGLSLLMGVVMLVYGGTLVKFESVTYEDTTTETSRPELRSYPRYNFHNYLHFGGYSGPPGKLPKPPDGEGVLRGRLVYDGKRVEGVSVQLTLNGKYESDYIVTDANGEFTQRLPPGDWRVNRVITRDWREKPEDGDFLIVTGREPKIGDGQYHRHYWMNEDGLLIPLGDQSTEPQLKFEIRKRITVVWPKPEGEKLEATAEGGVVSWEPYPGAAEYQVDIVRLKRDGTTTYSNPIVSRRLKGASRLALSSISAIPTQAEENEYQVSVFAFDKNGDFLSQSPEHYRRGTFVLTDKKEFVADRDKTIIGGELAPAKINELHRNKQRIEAVATLLEDGLIGEAEALFKKVKGEADPGRKQAIAGYLAASRGRCKEAENLFKQARIEAGENCVPNRYYAQCAAPGKKR